MKLWQKIIVTILVTAATAFCGLLGMLLMAFGGAGNFYTACVAVGAFILWLFVIAQVWNLLKPKVRYVLAGSMALALVLAITVFGAYSAYDKSIDRVSEQGVDLELYEPFGQNTKAARLNEPSTLKLTEALPKIDGATALYPLYSAFARAVYPENYNVDDAYGGDIEVEPGTIVPKKVDTIIACTNTDGAYRRLITGEADIIFVAGPSREQLDMAEREGVRLNLTPIGREAFVFFVNAKNPVDALSIGDIRRIYSGQAKNWSEFGGKNASIRAFQRPNNSGSQTALIHFMGDVPLMTPPKEDVADGMGGMIENVSAYTNYNNAIGYSFLFFTTEMVAGNKIKLLALNGVEPTKENVANSTYPCTGEFYAVTAGTDNPNAEKFIEWIVSAQGQYLVGQSGYTPLAASEPQIIS